MSERWLGLHNPERHEPHSGIADVYRVQVGKPWWRRKWQAEWELCHFAQRGYTRRGVLAMARLRRTHTRVNDAYVRARIIIRRNVTQREWYAARYTVTGARHSADGRGGAVINADPDYMDGASGDAASRYTEVRYAQGCNDVLNDLRRLLAGDYDGGDA